MTSVGVPQTEIAERIVQALISMIDGEALPQHTLVLEPQLIAVILLHEGNRYFARMRQLSLPHTSPSSNGEARR